MAGKKGHNGQGEMEHSDRLREQIDAFADLRGEPVDWVTTDKGDVVEKVRHLAEPFCTGESEHDVLVVSSAVFAWNMGTVSHPGEVQRIIDNMARRMGLSGRGYLQFNRLIYDLYARRRHLFPKSAEPIVDYEVTPGDDDIRLRLTYCVPAHQPDRPAQSDDEASEEAEPADEVPEDKASQDEDSEED